MAGFSSQGPTDVDFRVKPDVVAPGVNVLSLDPGSVLRGAAVLRVLQGTSMATPHLAGSAAVVRRSIRTGRAAEVRSAIVNTADRGVLKASTNGLPHDDVNIDRHRAREPARRGQRQGGARSGQHQLRRACRRAAGRRCKSTVTLNNLSGASQTVNLSISGQPATGVKYSVSPQSVTIAAGAKADVSVTMTLAKGAAAAGRQAYLEVAAGGANVAHAALFTLVK